MQGAPLLGQRIGPYELMHKISVGGMAETFLARRQGPGGFEQQVCLKRVLPAFAEDKEFARLFLDEARLAAQLRHTNIVQVYDFGVEDEAYYMALELIEGMDLRQLLQILEYQHRTIPAEIVAIIATELTSALEYAHALEINGKHAGVVHRDISPSNVLLSYTGSVKLADFGIAKAATHAHVTRSGVVKGKVPYMAPEHATGALIDARSDLFSLGVLLYESLTGYRPFDGSNEMATLTNLISGNYKRLAEAAPDTPAHFAEVIEKLLSAKPEDRYQSAIELMDALVHAAPPSTTKRTLGTLVREARSLQPTPLDIAKTSTTSGVIARPSGSFPTEEETRDDEKQPEMLPHESSDTKTQAASLHHRKPDQVKEIRPRTSTFIEPGVKKRFNRRALVVVLAFSAVIGAVSWGMALHRGQLRSQGPISIETISRPSGRDTQPVSPNPSSATRSTIVKPYTAKAAPKAAESVAIPRPAPSSAAPSGSTPESPLESEDDLESGAEHGRDGIVTVRILPWGNVWIDGVYYGKGPITKRLKPGNHKISGGHGRPIAERTLRVRPGRVHNLDVRVDG